MPRNLNNLKSKPGRTSYSSQTQANTLKSDIKGKEVLVALTAGGERNNSMVGQACKRMWTGEKNARKHN